MTPESHRDPPVDPSGIEAPHDTLAADSFAIPGPDPHLPAAQVRALPSDAAGIAEPHDTLAAEEFAIPAAGSARPGSTSGRRSWPARALLAGPALLIAARVVRRRRGR